MPALPFKLNQDGRRHIPEQKRKVVNWREYDESLRRRGSLTVWFSDEVIEAWKASPRTSRGGRPEYSDLAILTGLTLKAVFRLAYRQTEGLIGSVIGLLGPLCCTGRGRGRTGPYPVRGQAMRTDSGRPSSSMRLSAWTPTLTSVARRRSVRECSRPRSRVCSVRWPPRPGRERCSPSLS